MPSLSVLLISDNDGLLQGVALASEELAHVQLSVSTIDQFRKSPVPLGNPPQMVILAEPEPARVDLEQLTLLSQAYPQVSFVVLGCASAVDPDLMISTMKLANFHFISMATMGGTAFAYRVEAQDRIIGLLKNALLQQAYLVNRSESREEADTGDQETPGFNVVVLAVSTGGPNALTEVIPKLAPNLGVPVLVVQHMPASFTASLARNLSERSVLSVKEAEHDEPVLENTVYIAPGSKHMMLKRELKLSSSTRAFTHISLTDDPPENSCRPSADVLFRSVAEQYGPHVLAVVMTGMGSDGAKGVIAIKEKGGYCITQSKNSCVVYGMPRAVDELNLSNEQVDLDMLAERINHLVKRSRRSQQWA